MVNARLLVGMLERLGGESVMLSRNDTSLQLTVKSEKAFYQIPILGGDCFPQIEMPFPEDTIPVKGLPKMVKRIAFAVDKTNNEKPIGGFEMEQCQRLIELCRKEQKTEAAS